MKLKPLNDLIIAFSTAAGRKLRVASGFYVSWPRARVNPPP